MLKIKANEKEYTIKFTYKAAIKGKLIPLAVHASQAADSVRDGGVTAVNEQLEVLPAILLIGLQKFHADEFGVDWDNEESVNAGLDKVYDLIDVIAEDEESDSVIDILGSLYEDMMGEGFLKKMLGTAEMVETGKKKAHKAK